MSFFFIITSPVKVEMEKRDSVSLRPEAHAMKRLLLGLCTSDSSLWRWRRGFWHRFKNVKNRPKPIVV
jgi:hypothetical protein